MSVHVHSFTVEYVEVEWDDPQYGRMDRVDAKVMLANTEVWRQRGCSSYGRAVIGRGSFLEADEQVLQEFAMALRERLGCWGLEDLSNPQEREP